MQLSVGKYGILYGGERNDAMEDSAIVEMYWQRKDDAIEKTDEKYGKMLNGISMSVLGCKEDAEECVSDTYLAAWNRMPDERPVYLGAFLSKITRHFSIDRYRKNTAARRGGREIREELTECIPSSADVFEEIENKELARVIDLFLSELDEEKRVIFIRRYFYNDSVQDICKRFSLSSSKVKSVLHRLRGTLKKRLQEELYVK